MRFSLPNQIETRNPLERIFMFIDHSVGIYGYRSLVLECRQTQIQIQIQIQIGIQTQIRKVTKLEYKSHNIENLFRF